MSANVLHLTSSQKPGLYGFAAANDRNLRRLELASRPHRLPKKALRFNRAHALALGWVGVVKNLQAILAVGWGSLVRIHNCKR